MSSTLVADKASYAPGDTAHILVTSPFSQATGLLTVERGHIRSHRLVDLRGPAPVIDLPIDDELPAQRLPEPEHGRRRRTAPAGACPTSARATWRCRSRPPPSSSHVTITPSSTEAHPRDTVTYTVAVRDAAGRPAAAELSLALVDKAILLAGRRPRRPR